MSRKLPILLLSLCLLYALLGCAAAQREDPADAPADAGQSASTQEKAGSELADQSEHEGEAAPENASEVLVVVFSCTGTTMGVAEQIASIEGAEVYEILPAEPYSEEDRDWNDSDSRTTKEQNDPSVRPEIASEPIELTSFSRIYMGYPIWWGQAPRIMDTFVEGHDFGEAEVIPFCTSASSGIGSSGQTLAELAGSGRWLDGARFSGSVSEEELRDWVEGFD